MRAFRGDWSLVSAGVGGSIRGQRSPSPCCRRYQTLARESDGQLHMHILQPACSLRDGFCVVTARQTLTCNNLDRHCRTPWLNPALHGWNPWQQALLHTFLSRYLGARGMASTCPWPQLGETDCGWVGSSMPIVKKKALFRHTEYIGTCSIC